MIKIDIKKYFNELFPLSLEAAFNKLQTYEKSVKNNIDVIQMVFVKFFEHKEGKDIAKYSAYIDTNHYVYDWEICENKKELIIFVKNNLSEIMPYLKKIMKNGYYDFSKILFDFRLVYIFCYLKKFKEIYQLEKILHDVAYNKNYYIFYDCFGYNGKFQPESIQGHFFEGFVNDKKSFEKKQLFDINGNLLNNVGDNK